MCIRDSHIPNETSEVTIVWSLIKVNLTAVSVEFLQLQRTPVNNLFYRRLILSFDNLFIALSLRHSWLNALEPGQTALIKINSDIGECLHIVSPTLIPESMRAFRTEISRSNEGI